MDKYIIDKLSKSQKYGKPAMDKIVKNYPHLII